MPYLLDTTICVFFLRGKLNLDEKIKEKGRENCYISEITVFELRYGAENSDDPVKSHQSVDRFVNGLIIIPIFGCERRYAKEKVRLRRSGRPMHDEFDLLIGVTAVENQVTLVTDNVSDFERIEELKLRIGFNVNSTAANGKAFKKLGQLYSSAHITQNHCYLPF